MKLLWAFRIITVVSGMALLVITTNTVVDIRQANHNSIEIVDKGGPAQPFYVVDGEEQPIYEATP